MLDPNEEITGIDYEEDIETVVVRTEAQTDFEDKLKKKTLTSVVRKGQYSVISWRSSRKSRSPTEVKIRPMDLRINK